MSLTFLLGSRSLRADWISGTPTVSSALPYPVNITLTDGDGALITKLYSITVNEAIVLSNVEFPPATVSNAFSYPFAATGGSGSGYVFTTTSDLPPGLTLSPQGVLSGTITSNAGTPFILNIKVTDGQGASIMSSPLSLEVLPAITISPLTLPIATVGNAYNQQLTAAGGAGPLAATRSRRPVSPPAS